MFGVFGTRGTYGEFAGEREREIFGRSATRSGPSPGLRLGSAIKKYLESKSRAGGDRKCPEPKNCGATDAIGIRTLQEIEGKSEAGNGWKRIARCSRSDSE